MICLLLHCRDDGGLGTCFRYYPPRNVGRRSACNDLRWRPGEKEVFVKVAAGGSAVTSVFSLIVVQDFICNWVGNKAWLDVMPWHGAERWTVAADEPWAVEGAPAGTVKAVGPLSFVRVFKAGHMVSHSKGYQGAMFSAAEPPLSHTICAPNYSEGANGSGESCTGDDHSVHPQQATCPPVRSHR